MSNVNVVLDEKLNDGDEFFNGRLKIDVTRAEGDKCVRCWLISSDTGQDLEHPELCSRCTDIVKDIVIEEPVSQE